MNKQWQWWWVAAALGCVLAACGAGASEPSKVTLEDASRTRMQLDRLQGKWVLWRHNEREPLAVLEVVGQAVGLVPLAPAGLEIEREPRGSYVTSDGPTLSFKDADGAPFFVHIHSNTEATVWHSKSRDIFDMRRVVGPQTPLLGTWQACVPQRSRVTRIQFGPDGMFFDPLDEGDDRLAFELLWLAPSAKGMHAVLMPKEDDDVYLATFIRAGSGFLMRVESDEELVMLYSEGQRPDWADCE